MTDDTAPPKAPEQLADEYAAKRWPSMPQTDNDRRSAAEDFLAGHRSRDAEVAALQARLLEVRDGDTLVVEIERKLSVEDIARISDRLSAFMAERGWRDVRILVADQGYKLKVMRRLEEGGDG